VLLLLELDEQLSPEFAETALPLLAAHVDTTLAVWRDDVIRAMTYCTHAAAPSGDLLRRLHALAAAGLAGSPSHERAGYCALAAALSKLVTDAERSALVGPLLVAARQGDWDAGGALWFVDPTQVDRPLADQFLDRVRQTIEALQKQVQGNTRSLNIGYSRAMYFAAAERASLDRRVETVAIALRFIRETGHLRTARVAWLEPATRLAIGAPSARREAAALLGEVARAGLEEDDRVPNFGDHPLSAIRINTGGSADAARFAAQCLALLATVSDDNSVDAIVSALIVATHAQYAGVRMIAAKALGATPGDAISARTATPVSRHPEARRRLLELKSDPDDAVKLAAYQALDDPGREASAV
jgi:hypothetical protein